VVTSDLLQSKISISISWNLDISDSGFLCDLHETRGPHLLLMPMMYCESATHIIITMYTQRTVNL
jgi:hypothetical protein